MQPPIPYTQEYNFLQMMQGPVHQLWQQREEGFLPATGGKKLYWIRLTAPSNTKAIVVVNGRMESVWKYQELFYELFSHGFDIYSFDHRGQGMSDRLLTHYPERGFVEDFNHYVEDMKLLVQHFSMNAYQQKFLLAHSMGGTIATRYIQTTPDHPFNRIALCAPMFGINIPAHLKPFSRPYSWLLKSIHPVETYAPGQTDYQSKGFANNLLTHSQSRYRWFRDLYTMLPELQLGGSTIHWVWQSLNAIRSCIRQTRNIHIPIQILQAGEDEIVDNQAQYRFYRRLKRTNSHSVFTRLEGSRHEILCEQDLIRNQALRIITAFFTQEP
ncbi:lysophospholipase [Vibrio sp. HA2012]|uniref:alpha/beta fold hydrolase n=1 Tax=Vibrio sp. HA2012 TaxID=1971595 RepID=UPI000C2CB0F9|nr:alpha/beta fold hydrolase [Vibrio sp. HA2012]PJC84987.1 lysophospholipase [Vibrio sp. HA2012]